MLLDQETFLTTVYCIVDDLYQTHYARAKPRRPGRKPTLSDSEVLTLALLAQWHPKRSETAFWRYAAKHWRAYFPHLVSRSDLNRRLRDLWGVLSQLGPALYQLTTQQLGPAAYQVLDGVPVPLMRRCRGNRHRSFGSEAAVGYGGSDHEWYYGVKLLGAVSPVGGMTGFVVAPANTDERWDTEALLRWRAVPTAPAPRLSELADRLGPRHRKGGHRRGPTGPLWSGLSAGAVAGTPYIADLGFRGVQWQQHWQQVYGATILTPAEYATIPTARTRRQWRTWLSGLRQTVETVFQALCETFGLKFPRARSLGGLLTRIAAKVAALNLAIHINHLFQRPPFAFFDPLV
jgi:hypothetical protein